MLQRAPLQAWKSTGVKHQGTYLSLSHMDVCKATAGVSPPWHYCTYNNLPLTLCCAHRQQSLLGGLGTPGPRDISWSWEQLSSKHIFMCFMANVLFSPKMRAVQALIPTISLPEGCTRTHCLNALTAHLNKCPILKTEGKELPILLTSVQMSLLPAVCEPVRGEPLQKSLLYQHFPSLSQTFTFSPWHMWALSCQGCRRSGHLPD